MVWAVVVFAMVVSLSGVSDWFLSCLLERENPTIVRGMTLW